jgi:hypothetical protein
MIKYFDTFLVAATFTKNVIMNLIVYYATRFINGTLDTRFMLGTSEA